MFTQKLKDKWITEMQAHQDADRLVQGAWLDAWHDTEEDGIFSGCFFGCAMQTDESPLVKAADAMQLPLWLIELAEHIFESLPPQEAILFPVQLLRAIPVETDLEPVYRRDSYSDIALSRTSAWQQSRDHLLKALIDLGK